QKQAEESLARMRGVLEGFRALAAAEVDARRFQPVNLDALVDSVLAEHASEPATVEMTVQRNLPTVLGDRTLLAEVFRQLIQNARAYRREGVRATVRIAARDLADSHVVEISDNGRGIPREALRRVFAPGYRVEGSEEMD